MRIGENPITRKNLDKFFSFTFLDQQLGVARALRKREMRGGVGAREATPTAGGPSASQLDPPSTRLMAAALTDS